MRIQDRLARNSGFARRGVCVLLAQALVFQGIAVPYAAAADSCSTASNASATVPGRLIDGEEGVLPDASPASNSSEVSSDSSPPQGTGDSAYDADQPAVGPEGGDRGDSGGTRSNVPGTDGNGVDVGLELKVHRFNFNLERLWKFDNLSALEEREKKRRMPLPELNIVADPIDLRMANKSHVQLD